MSDLEITTGWKQPGRLRRAFKRLVPEARREDVRAWAMNTPYAFEIFSLIDPRVRHRRISKHTDLVLDGFARSGNSYALCAFLEANGVAYRVSSHLHTPRSIEVAVAKGVPTVVLIRHPAEVLGSTVQFSQRRNAADVLDIYLAFYERVLKVADGIVLADFPDTTSDFGSVIRRCNDKFGTSFVAYEKTDANEAAVFARLDTAAIAVDPDRFDSVVGRPSGGRRDAAAIQAELGPDDRDRLARAEALYRRLIG